MTLKSGTPQQISTMYKRLNNQVGALIKEVTTLAYHMKGGMSYRDIMYSMSYIERDIALNYTSEQIKAEYKIKSIGG